MAYSVAQQFYIDQLRSQLSMRLSPASGSSFILPAKLGDEELWEDLRNGIQFFNSYPPVLTTYSFKDLYAASQTTLDSGGDPLAPESETAVSIYGSAILICAQFFTGLRLQWFEAGKHFRYNDNGISIERAKQADYQNIVGSNILTYITSTLTVLKKSIGLQNVYPKGLFSGMVSMPRSLTRGLRGTRLGR